MLVVDWFCLSTTVANMYIDRQVVDAGGPVTVGQWIPTSAQYQEAGRSKRLVKLDVGAGHALKSD